MWNLLSNVAHSCRTSACGATVLFYDVSVTKRVKIKMWGYWEEIKKMKILEYLYDYVSFEYMHWYHVGLDIFVWFKQYDNEIIKKMNFNYSGFSGILFFGLQSLVCLVCHKSHIYMVLRCSWLFWQKSYPLM